MHLPQPIAFWCRWCQHGAAGTRSRPCPFSLGLGRIETRELDSCVPGCGLCPGARAVGAGPQPRASAGGGRQRLRPHQPHPGHLLPGARPPPCARVGDGALYVVSRASVASPAHVASSWEGAGRGRRFCSTRPRVRNLVPGSDTCHTGADWDTHRYRRVPRGR